MITIYLKQYNKIIRNADPKLFDELGYDDILWIDLLNPTIKEQKAVEGFMEISLQTKQQVEEIESTSKYSSFRTKACWCRCARPNSARSARPRSGCR